ncbi:MAG: hypothetical protein GJ677_09725 [Rhodobacteraceae bacterium]|nr:hypothetical protein [Paracoccaceae bacterium]
MSDEDWKAFAGAWLSSMTDFRDGNLTLQQTFDLILNFEGVVDKEITQFACNVVSEIDGYPCDFEETLALLQDKPSRKDVLRFINA